MKLISEMTQIEIAAYVQTHLRQNGIDVILCGGAATGYYSANKYVSGDIDLVNHYSISRSRIKKAMEQIGFIEQARYFKHPESEFLIEFPPGPLSIGIEPVENIEDFELSSGILRIVSPTDSVKDRLAAFYHWGDRQCLYQAILVSQTTQVDQREIERWSINEGKEKEYREYVQQIAINNS
jgi:hypothetical protein